MRRILLWLFIALGIGGLGLGYYTFYVRPSEDPLWRLVPPSAALLYAHADAQSLVHALDTADIWQLLRAHYTHTRTQSPARYALRETLLQALATQAAPLHQTPVRISLHAQNAYAVACVFYVQCDDTRQQALQQWLLDAVPNATYTAQPFEGVQRYEMRLNDADALYFFFQDDYWVGSFSALLIEDAIRWRIQHIPHPLAETHTALRLYWDEAPVQWYVNYEASLSLLRRLRPTYAGMPPIPTAAIQGHAQLTQNTDPQTQHIFASGTSLLSEQTNARLMAFDEDAPTALPLARLIPNRTLSVLTYQFKDPVQWNKRMIDLWTQDPKGVLDARIALFASYNIDLTTLFPTLGTQVSLLRVEDEEATTAQRLLFIHVQDVQALQKRFTHYARTLNTTPFSDQYRGHAVHYIDIQELPQWLFGVPFAGFSGLFYVIQNQVLIGSASLSALRATIDDIEEERTWGQTPMYARQYAQALGRAHVSWWVNMNRMPRHLIASLKGPWKAFVAGYIQRTHAQPALLGMQWQRTAKDKAYTQWVAYAPDWHAPTQPTEKTLIPDTDTIAYPQANNAFEVKGRIRLLHPIQSKPLLVYHPQKRAYVVFLQDDTHQLYALEDMRIAWRAQLQGPLVSPIYAMDYRKNNQTQYVCATATQVYMYEGDGRPVEGFPRALPNATTRIRALTLVDYAGDKNYRYFIAAADAALWITDKRLRPLTGWAPKKLSHPAAHPPFHIRIGNRDVMGAMLQNGDLHLYRRNGTPYAGFPYDLKEAVHHPPIIQKGPDLARSYLVLMTQGGRHIRLSFTGQLRDEAQQYRPTPDTQFRFIKDVLKKGYIGVAYDNEAMRFFSSDMQPLFSLQTNILPDKLVLQYYQFSDTAPLLTYLDPTRNALYFYNLQGQQPLPPLPSTQHGIALLYNAQQQYTIHQVQNNQYSIRSTNPSIPSP